MTRSRLFTILKVVGALFAGVLLLLTIRSAVRELGSSEAEFELGRALLAVGVLTAIFLAQIQLWRIVVADLGSRVSYADAWRIWSFSQLGRYLPGKAWQVVGQVVLARDAGVPARTATLAAFLSVGFMISTGLLVSLVFVGRMVLERWGALGLLAAVVVVGLGLSPIAWPRVLRSGLRLLGRQEVELPLPSRPALLRWLLYYVLSWLAHGLAFQLFASSFGELGRGIAPQVIGAYALAYVSGLVAVFAPGGLGVREGALGVILASFVGTELPVYAVAVAARLWNVAAELLVLAGALALSLSRARRRA
jgi:uncharacterized membrane protein YbhN (UPF0104 family)